MSPPDLTHAQFAATQLPIMHGLSIDDLVSCARSVWAPGIGDATPMGWVIALSYFYTAILIVYMLRKLRRIAPDRRRRYAQFWLLIMAIYVLLGINKQLDLQTFVTATGRCMARAEGWYQDRRNIQLEFILAGIAVGSLLLFAFLYYFQDLVARCRLAFTGLGITALFVLLRAVSFHHVDVVFGMTVLDVKLHSILELTGIALVAINAAMLAYHRVQRSPQSSMASAARES